jgi:hypothetical protein
MTDKKEPIEVIITEKEHGVPNIFGPTIKQSFGYLNENLENFNKTSEELQKKLIFWTKVMAGAIIIQAVAIGVQVYFQLK